MSVYVDDLFPVMVTRKWRWPMVAHLVADSEEELHRFAASVGLRRPWYQQGHYHYDLTPNKRLAAIKAGALQVSRREMARIVRGQAHGT